MNILQRSMASQGILNDTQTTLADYLMSIAQIPWRMPERFISS